MKKCAFVTLAGVYLAIGLCSGWASAQSNPLPLGQVNLPVKSVTCPAGFAAGTSCYGSTVTCSGTLEIGFTYGVVNTGGDEGTVVFFNGAGGTTLGFAQFVAAYIPPAHNFQTVQVVWATPWEDTGNSTGNSLKAAACRPATVLDWLLNQKNVYAGGGMCAQGASAGSAAIAYSLTQYGAHQYLNHVALESGPVISDVSVGCSRKSTSLTVCPGSECRTGNEGSWSDSPIYVDGEQASVSTWTGARGGNSCGGNNVSPSQYTAWKQMSIVDGLTGGQSDSTFAYPNTSISAWLCSKPPGCNSASCQNNSAAQGQLYYQKVTTSKIVYRVDGCQGTEGVDQGTVPELNNESGSQSIIADMVDQCR